jgi:hypothetical protein
MKRLSFLSLLIGLIFLEDGAHALTPIKIVNQTGVSYPRIFIYAYAGDAPSTVVIHSQVISKDPNSVSNSIYSESGNFKGLTIRVEPEKGAEGPQCHIDNYPDDSIPVITIINSTLCTITSPSQSSS